MSTDLVAWLRAQLDEDGRLIAEHPDGEDGDLAGRDLAAERESNYPCSAYLRIAKARALAELAAKRWILDLHRLRETVDEGVRCRLCGFSFRVDPNCHTVRLLALPYADRPGFREEWRP